MGVRKKTNDCFGEVEEGIIHTANIYVMETSQEMTSCSCLWILIIRMGYNSSVKVYQERLGAICCRYPMYPQCTLFTITLLPKTINYQRKKREREEFLAYTHKNAVGFSTSLVDAISRRLAPTRSNTLIPPPCTPPATRNRRSGPPRAMARTCFRPVATEPMYRNCPPMSTLGRFGAPGDTEREVGRVET